MIGVSTRINWRLDAIATAYLELITYFESLGDTTEEAESKVIQLSRDVNSRNGFSKFDYTLGDTQPLKDEIQASQLTFMDQAAKNLILSYL